MLSRIRPRLNHATIVAYLALVVALGGSSYAAVKINGKDIKNKSIAGKKLKNRTITSAKVKKNALGGTVIKESTLGLVPTANSANVAKSASNANALDGIDSAAFTRGACGVKNGAIHGYARIIASSIFSSSFTTTDVESPYNCSGQPVEARRTALGLYEVRFNGTVGGLAVATNMQAPSISPSNVNVSLSRTPTGTFVATVALNGGGSIDWPFVIVLL